MEVGRAAASLNPELTVSVGSHVTALAGAMVEHGVPADRIRMFEDTDSAAREVPRLLGAGDTVLLKASRGLHFEKIRDAIESRFSA